MSIGIQVNNYCDLPCCDTCHDPLISAEVSHVLDAAGLAVIRYVDITCDSYDNCRRAWECGRGKRLSEVE